MGSWDLPKISYELSAIKGKGPLGRIRTLGTVLRYGFLCGRMTGGKVTKVDVDGMVEKWMKAIIGMSLAHSKDEFDAEDAKSDELMTPLLTAPIKQVREFYQKLRDGLKANPQVPMLVWMGFEAWGEIEIDKSVDDIGIKRLKTKLAGEIADIVELPIRDQIPEAIKRALRWRDPQTLEAVKETLQAGAKPKLVGRQSCLFLEGGKGRKKFSVML
jgi:hypothetical protein